MIGRFIRHGEPVVAQYAFQMRDSRGGWGLLERTRVRPQYYVYQLYRHFGDELVYAATDDPNVMVVAAIRDDGALTLMAVNLGDTAVSGCCASSATPAARPPSIASTRRT